VTNSDKKLARATGHHFEYEFYVVRDDLNAFALPGGKCLSMLSHHLHQIRGRVSWAIAHELSTPCFPTGFTSLGNLIANVTQFVP